MAHNGAYTPGSGGSLWLYDLALNDAYPSTGQVAGTVLFTGPNATSRPTAVTPFNPVPVVRGDTDIITPTLAVSTSAYTAGFVCGGKLTLTNAMRVSGGTGKLRGVSGYILGNLAPALEILIFDRDPSNGTYTDRTAFSRHNTDMGYCIGRVPVAISDWVVLGTSPVATFDVPALTIDKVVKAFGSANLYAIVVIQTGTTFATTADLGLRFAFERD